MIATRTLPSSSRALPLVVATGSSGKLLAYVQDALDDREPRRRGERDDRPRQSAPRCEDEPGRDERDTLGARAQADVAPQSERLGAGARVGDEERPDDRPHRDHDCPLLSVAGEDERDRGEHRALADSVGRRVDERAERGGLAAYASERAVEDVEQRADDEDAGGEPVDEPCVGPVRERNENGGGEAERDPGGGQHVRRYASSRKPRHRPAGDGAGPGRVPVLDTPE